MKKVLMGATALTMIGAASGAVAQEWSADVGGFFTAGVGYVDAEAQEAGGDIVANSEVTFNFRMTADNGLTFSAKAELENNSGGEDGANMDEYVARVGGAFGTIEIGAEDGAADRLHGGPAGGTAFTAIGDAAGLLGDYSTNVSGYEIDTDGGESGDALKITYFTPTFSGFSAGISYAPTGGDEGLTSTDGTTEDGEILELGAGYSNTFSGVDVSAGFGYAFSFDDDADESLEEGIGGSLNVGFGGFTIGGSVGLTNERGEDTSTGYAIGANYATGPWLFGLQFAQGVDGAQEDHMGVSAGVDYALAPGVTVGAIAEYYDADDATFVTEAATGGFSIDQDSGEIEQDEDAAGFQAATREEFDDSFAIGVFMNLDF